MGRKLRQHKIMIYALAALWLLPYAALLFAAPIAPSGNLAALIMPEATDKSAEAFGAKAFGASFQERGSFLYSPLHIFSFSSSPQGLAYAAGAGGALSIWGIIAFVALMLAAMYRHDGKKGMAAGLAYTPNTI